MKRPSGDFFYDDDKMLNGTVAIESAPAPYVFTGLLAASGAPIYRIPAERPSIGFVTRPGEAHLYHLDPDVDFYYGTIDDQGHFHEEGDE